MITYTKIQAVFIYFYAGVYGIVAVFGLFGGLISGDTGALAMSILFVPIAYALHLFAQAHFRIAKRALNYINFCQAHGLNDDDKEHSVEFYKQFKLEIK